MVLDGSDHTALAGIVNGCRIICLLIPSLFCSLISSFPILLQSIEVLIKNEYTWLNMIKNTKEVET